MLGIDPTRVDDTAQFPLGTKADDPRATDFPGNKIQYVKAGAALVYGTALQYDIAVTAGSPSIRGKQVLPCAATTPLTQVVSAICHVAAAINKFCWVTVEGLVPNCVVPDALAVGTAMIGGASAAFVDASAAGTETAELDYSMAGGLRCLLVEDMGTSLGRVQIG
jgi:hypothetical protein